MFLTEYTSRILDKMKKQVDKGMKEYGQPLEDNTFPDFKERWNYASEELIDLLYCGEWLVDCYDEMIATEHDKALYMNGFRTAVYQMSKAIRDMAREEVTNQHERARIVEFVRKAEEKLKNE